jgi:hypothetical protein
MLGEGFLAFVIRVRDLSPYSLLGNCSLEKSVPTGNDQIYNEFGGVSSIK